MNVKILQGLITYHAIFASIPVEAAESCEMKLIACNLSGSGAAVAILMWHRMVTAKIVSAERVNIGHLLLRDIFRVECTSCDQCTEHWRDQYGAHVANIAIQPRWRSNNIKMNCQTPECGDLEIGES